MSFLEELEELSRKQRREVGALSHRFGFDGTPIGNFADLVPKRRKRKKVGRPKGRKNYTLRERLMRKYPDEEF